jgi:GDP-L-fucose synthase
MIGRRVLVTGGTGFLGQHICQLLKQTRAAELIMPRGQDVDLRDATGVRELFQRYQPHVVIHLPAAPGSAEGDPKNLEQHAYDYAVRSIQLMETARRCGVAKFLCIGTDCGGLRCARTSLPARHGKHGELEKQRCAHEFASEMLLQMQAYRQEYGVNAVTLLPLNMYGPGDAFHSRNRHIIPTLIRKAIAARYSGYSFFDICSHESTSAEFLFVRDAAKAILLAAEQYHGAEPVTIRSGQEVTLSDLATTICELCGFTGEVRWHSAAVEGQRPRPDSSAWPLRRFALDAYTSLEDGLAETIAWYWVKIAAREKLIPRYSQY